MDNTARDAKAAKAAGISYGKWKILHPETKPKPPVKQWKYTRICPECDIEFGTDNPCKKFCCAEHAARYNGRAHMRRQKEKLNAMSKL